MNMYIDNGAPPSNALLAYATSLGATRFCASYAGAIAHDAIGGNQGFDSPLMIANGKL
jgi:hypothetical protein